MEISPVEQLKDEAERLADRGQTIRAFQVTGWECGLSKSNRSIKQETRAVRVCLMNTDGAPMGCRAKPQEGLSFSGRCEHSRKTASGRWSVFYLACFQCYRDLPPSCSRQLGTEPTLQHAIAERTPLVFTNDYAREMTIHPLEETGPLLWHIFKPRPRQGDQGLALQGSPHPRIRPVTHNLFIVLPPPLRPLLVVNHHASKLALMLPSLVPHRGEAERGASTWGDERGASDAL